MGSLSTVSAPQLGAIAIKGALNQINLNPDLVGKQKFAVDLIQ